MGSSSKMSYKTKLLNIIILQQFKLRYVKMFVCILNSNNCVVYSIAKRSMLMTHGSMERNNVYLCAKYLLPIQHLDVKLLKVAINKVRRNEDVPECNTGQVILELCLVRYGNLGTEGKIKIKIK